MQRYETMSMYANFYADNVSKTEYSDCWKLFICLICYERVIRIMLEGLLPPCVQVLILF